MGLILNLKHSAVFIKLMSTGQCRKSIQLTSILYMPIVYNWWLYCYYYNFILGHYLIRWQFSGKSISQREIKVTYPSTLQNIRALLISVVICQSVADRWPGSNWNFWSNLILSSSPPPLCWVFTIIYLRQTIFLGHSVPAIFVVIAADYTFIFLQSAVTWWTREHAPPPKM